MHRKIIRDQAQPFGTADKVASSLQAKERRLQTVERKTEGGLESAFPWKTRQSGSYFARSKFSA
jgi:hypothetical protein